MMISKKELARIFILGTLLMASPIYSQTTNKSHLFFKNNFDLQAHRGGIGLTVESTIASFSNALEVGVTTLELDTQITKDGVAVVTHDRKISNKKCQDTQPAFAGDPDYPYVGKYIIQLTLDQVKTLDCGSLSLTDFPDQVTDPGAKMPTLMEVFDLVKSYRAYGVLLNVETKVEAGAPEETASQEIFVDTVLSDIYKANMINQVTIQSFDWGAIMLVRQKDSRIPIVALTNGDQFLQPGQPGASPWLGGIDIDDFNGDLVAAVASFGADALSPVYGTRAAQQNRSVTDDYIFYTTKELVDRAHSSNIKVIPWTVDDTELMQALIDFGVDGIITDYPNLLRDVMSKNGLAMPIKYSKSSGVQSIDTLSTYSLYLLALVLFGALYFRKSFASLSK